MGNRITIGSHEIGPGRPAFLIAEAGVNHDGDMEKAKRLIDAAKDSSADAVKFQSFVTERLIRRDAPKAAYQDRNIGAATSQFAMLKQLELTQDQAAMLKRYAEGKSILFLSTAYDPIAVDELEAIGVAAYKLASIETVNHPLIRRTARTGKPVILSVGMATEAEVAAAVAAFRDEAADAGTLAGNLILLQCNTNYPAAPEDQHLRAMESLRRFVPVVGFSDHTEGDTVAIGAIALGANVIEKHFTLNRNDPGPDHKASMEPDAFRALVGAVRVMERALGSPDIVPRGGEKENIVGMRKSISAARDIPRGTVITEDMLTAKRPGNGLYATDDNLAKIIGRRAARDIRLDENILLADVA
ncbi:MAG: hypothetical protein A3A44_00555 [Candidatus Sungbacteria bacterium RIFCSPLOWO2_01_FULL_60_25]|uniref:AFP-like domain-containing protein n=1 Tax=Candidatus Sungbacteria bacterium RIFCSPLOWO2_01_FULL_60_25 TaxID=1802281 RepID=A0A1G2LBM4_9BACT|nr:MAG: hypothetical protein A3A44_00555 [Candidatus Sungbacteria bacterium RIFCSPLOWO2_01_FULL_60_25]